jgi:galactose mutarotase-like enzyme
MIHTISNDRLSVQVSEKGAELQSIFHKNNNLEYLWSAASVWPKKSPVLFPIVGGLKNSTYKYEGNEYKLGRHGFARDKKFKLSELTETSALLSLPGSNETKRVYPFDFVFNVRYTVESSKLTITFIVENSGSSEMFFSVGAHPAFAVPLDKELQYDDYFLKFNQPETAGRWPLSEEGLIEKEPVPLLQDTDTLPLSKELFYKDAVVFKDLKSSSISLLSHKSPHGLTVTFDGFPYMGIWAAKDADFVCIEPWCGIADGVDATGELSSKEGILKLPAKTTFEASYSIEVF